MSGFIKPSEESITEIREATLENIRNVKQPLQLMELLGMEAEEVKEQIDLCLSILTEHIYRDYKRYKESPDFIAVLEEMLEKEIHPVLAFIYTCQAFSIFETNLTDGQTEEWQLGNLESYNTP